ncbi:MAG: restriction endonuclease [Clostridiaceae bacterium]|nr:restriction endonuclease [Clostridiaceae bacterium]
MNNELEISDLMNELEGLSRSQILWLKRIVDQFKKPYKFERNVGSDIIDDFFLEHFGTSLLVHHCISDEPFSKDKFEYLMVTISRMNGLDAELSAKGLRGPDITIDNTRYSLKTEASRYIKTEKVHISKFMELGKGRWVDEGDLIDLRNQYLLLLNEFDRLLTLRTLSKPPNDWHYELVEIPKSILSEAEFGTLEMKHDSKQNPKPGYCHVHNENNELKYHLYFDGGSERKLQVNHLDKKYCIVHANWYIAR